MTQQNNKESGIAAGQGYRFDPTILREYDIRGQIGKNLAEEDAFALGQAFGSFVKAQYSEAEEIHICIGCDGRHSSPALLAALENGLVSTGAFVENVGLGPTPMLYFASKSRGAHAGVMVTGSHNPPDYNGFKMMTKDGPVFGDLIQDLGALAESGAFAQGAGRAEQVDIQGDYVARLLKDLNIGDKKMRIAWDSGNGASGDVLQALVRKLPGEHILLFEDIDGSFPNHHPDPTVDKNLVDLIKVVRERECDLGIAFDGDGDRIGVIDENGTVLRCDILLTLYAREIIEASPGATIIGDVKCSQAMFDEIAEMGGTPVMWKTGHSLIKDKMAETSAPLAGELSGHIFFADKYYGFDDALYCGIRLMNVVAYRGQPLSELTKHLNGMFATPEVRFDVEEAEKFDLVPRVYDALKSAQDGSYTINDIDGVRVSTEDGWWLLRPSNTQSVLVARAEGKTQDGLDRLSAMAINVVKQVGYTLDFSA